MSIILDEYRLSWALRYIREAYVDLLTAEKDPIPAMSISYALRAMRKSQTAVYYSLGDPAYLTPLINQKIVDEKKTKNALMLVLIRMEKLVQRDSGLAETLGKNVILEEARNLTGLASSIVDLILHAANESMA